MRESHLAKSDSSFELLNNWHDRFASALTFEYSTRRVETSFGFTDVISTGRVKSESNDDGVSSTPIVLLHGAMAGAPFALGELGDLPAKRPMFAVNIPGQSTRAAQVRLDFRSGEYGQWLSEILDKLELDRIILCGVSWGGSVALQMAKHFPQRIKGLALVVPGSIVRGPVFAGFFRLGFPVMRYKLFPSQKNLERALAGLCTSQGELWTPYLADALRHWNVDFSVPPLMTAEDLKSLQAPVHVIAADQDICFPGLRLIERSKELFPHLVGTQLLKNCKHCPSFQDVDRVEFASHLEEAIADVNDSEA